MASRPRVYSIPASAPFLPTLARALVAGELVPGYAPRDPLDLARATIYLPTRRACGLARNAFLAVLGNDAAILPRIVALGDIDADEFVFAEAAGVAALDLPKTLDGFERRALLAKMILSWGLGAAVSGAGGAPLVARSPAAALALADDLARLMDDFATRQVPWNRLDGLVPADLDQYWQLTLKFLDIARTHWPALLLERGAIEPAVRRDLLIAAEAERLAALPDAPVIAAGSTGSMPATAELLTKIAHLPHGAVVLPGLDAHLDDAAWVSLAGDDNDPPHAGHPQFAMQALLARMGVARDNVKPIGTPAPHDRALLVSEALRPSESTDQWPQRLAHSATADALSAAMDAVTIVEAATAEEEALAIAIALREAVEQDGATAALVTPDRALARRVGAALGRWDIVADDSGGDRLAATPAGVFARLVADAALGGLAPITLLALLKHPLLRLDANTAAQLAAVRALERALLHGSRPRAGSGGLADALATVRREWEKLKRGVSSDIHRSDPRALLTAADFDTAGRLLGKLKAAIDPFESLATARSCSLATLAVQHREALANLSGGGDAPAAFAGNDGVKLLAALDAMTDERRGAGIEVGPAEYGEVFDAAISDQVVRRAETPGARVRTLGLLEARLADFDCVVLGGLIEGAWPPDTRNDAWLSRPMRRALGLDLPERRVGLTAHDFAQLMGTRQVVLTHATKVAGAPTVASRFLQRLAAVAGEARWEKACARGERYLAWARALDRPVEPPTPCKRPEPRPPRAARPAALSVTEIEMWLRDPYSIYARHILRLRPLDQIDLPPGARDRGILIHGAVGDFTALFAEKLPDDIVGELIRLGEQHFEGLQTFPEARAFWWPRFLRIAQWFAGFEATRRQNAAAISAEIHARLEIPAGERTFTLSTRADRIERLRDGSYAILDYKTGSVPTPKQVAIGLSPQLTLEGAMLRAGSFNDIPAGASIAEFVYVSLKGGDPAGEPRPITWPKSSPNEESDKANQRLTTLVTRFEDEATPYLSKERPMFIRRPGDYDHLARVREWSLTGGESEGVEE